MIVRFTRVNERQHRFAYTRADGQGEERLLETRSLLYHDLLHYAVETEGGLAEGFYGQLAAGRALDALTTGGGVAAHGDEAAQIEGVVGALTGAFKTEAPDAEIAASITRYHADIGRALPDWFHASFVSGVRTRMRALEGQWRATPFGGTMELAWPSRPAPAPA